MARRRPRPRGHRHPAQSASRARAATTASATARSPGSRSRCSPAAAAHGVTQAIRLVPACLVGPPAMSAWRHSCPTTRAGVVATAKRLLTWGDRGDTNPRPSGRQPGSGHRSRHEPTAVRIVCRRSVLYRTQDGRRSPHIAGGGVVASLLPGSGPPAGPRRTASLNSGRPQRRAVRPPHGRGRGGLALRPPRDKRIERPSGCRRTKASTTSFIIFQDFELSASKCSILLL